MPNQFELVEQLREFDVGPGHLRAIFDVFKGGLKWVVGHEEGSCRISTGRVFGFEESSVVASPLPSEHPCYEQMLEILEHEWFSRLWAYQEYSLALCHSCLEYLLEDHTVPWTTFGDVEQFPLEEKIVIEHSPSMVGRFVNILNREGS